MSESEKPSQPDPKIVVDSDWKEQVAREKEMASEADASADQVPPGGASPAEKDDASPAENAADETSSDTDVTATQEANDESTESPLPHDAEGVSPPPASFEILVTMLFTQAMAALGQMPDPSTGKASVNKPFAKHFIDTLDMLGGKTEGNLSEVEKRMLSEALHALRMAYVNVKG